MTRFVFDTNVVISALLFDESIPGEAFRKALRHGELLLSVGLAVELYDVLSRRKFDRYVTSDERNRFLAALIREAEFVDVTELIQVCRDPKDDHVLELAVSGRASFIVTGDQDLLALSPFRTIPILTPLALLEALDERHGERKK